MSQYKYRVDRYFSKVVEVTHYPVRFLHTLRPVNKWHDLTRPIVGTGVGNLRYEGGGIVIIIIKYLKGLEETRLVRMAVGDLTYPKRDPIERKPFKTPQTLFRFRRP